MSNRAEWARNETYTPRHTLHAAPEQAAIIDRDTSRRFHDLMDAAMCVSGFKYGPTADGFPEHVDAIKSLKTRLREYAATGNVEFLVDAANFAMIEFMHPRKKKAYYAATDSKASPGRVTDVGETAMSNKDLTTIAANEGAIPAK